MTAETKIPQRAVAVVTDNQATSQRIWGLTRISIGSDGKGPSTCGRVTRRGLLPEYEPHRPAGISKTGDDRTDDKTYRKESALIDTAIPGHIDQPPRQNTYDCAS